MKTYKVKLYPSNDRIVEGSIVRHNDTFSKVLSVSNNIVCFTEDNRTYYTSISFVKLFKYYVICKNNIIGELNFNDYDSVENEQIVNNVRIIEQYVKPEVGDSVELCKPLLHNCNKRMNVKARQGIIVELHNRKATIDIHSEILTDVRRHRYKLVSRYDKKNVCYLL